VAGHLFGARALLWSRARPAYERALAAVVLLALAAAVVASDVDPAWLRGNLTFGELGVGTAEGLAARAGSLLVASLAAACVTLMVPATSRIAEALGWRSLAIYSLHIAGVLVLQPFFERFHDGLGNGASIAVAVAVSAAALVLAVLGGTPFFDRVVRAVSTLLSSRLPATRSPDASGRAGSA
jgi:fucose 4-O-acetylase-like acetyltransferase